MDSNHDHHAMHSGHDMHSGHEGHDMHAGHSGHDIATAITQNIAQVFTKAQQIVASTTSSSPIEHNHSLHAADHAQAQNSVDHLHHGMGHSMTFHGGYDETVLFEWWKFNSLGGLLASVFAIFMVAILYEGLKYYREYLFWSTSNSLEYRVVQAPEEKTETGERGRVVQPRMISKIHFWQTFLHAVQVTVSYLLMLIFMTYNTWLCLAVVAGAATGNFLFGWKKSIIVDVTEHCH